MDEVEELYEALYPQKKKFFEKKKSLLILYGFIAGWIMVLIIRWLKRLP